jgi:hypothetical protein
LASAQQGQTIIDCAPPDCTFIPYTVSAGDVIVFDALASFEATMNWSFEKTTDTGTTILDAGSGTSTTYNYAVSPSDISSTILQFRLQVNGSD